jgi:hypothetical protein
MVLDDYCVLILNLFCKSFFTQPIHVCAPNVIRAKKFFNSIIPNYINPV